MAGRNPLYEILKYEQTYNEKDITIYLSKVDETRIQRLIDDLEEYFIKNFPKIASEKNGINDYNLNPYVLSTSECLMELTEPSKLSEFIFYTKMYMGFETSFGKSIENVVMQGYPISHNAQWNDPPEKKEESDELKGLTREERAIRRSTSVWREVDKSCIIGKNGIF